MPLPLPEADSTPLPQAPLELVVCQLRFEERITVSDPQTILDLQAYLAKGVGDSFARLESVKRAQLEFAAGLQVSGGGRSEILASGWRLRSTDSVWTVTVMPDQVLVETNRYPGWEAGFRPILHTLIDAVGEYVRPSFEQRLGLRYINGVRRPEVKVPLDWRAYIAPRLLGPLSDDVLGPGIWASQQQLSLELDEGIWCTLRHGLAVDDGSAETSSYVLDYDVYRDRGQAFDVESLKIASDRLNDFALRLFHASITAELLERLAAE